MIGIEHRSAEFINPAGRALCLRMSSAGLSLGVLPGLANFAASMP